MNSLEGKKILIFQQRGWALTIGHFLAKKLQGEGCGLAALTFKNTTHEFVINQKEVKYDFIISNDEAMNEPKKYLGRDDYSLEEICENLGVDSIWPYLATIRNYVRSYKDKYYYGFKQNVSDEMMVDFIKAVYKNINVFFNEFKADVVIGPNIISLPHIMINLYAQKRGIKFISVSDSKIRGYSIFSYDFNNVTGDFYDRVDELNQKKAVSDNKEKAKRYIKEFRNNFITPEAFDSLKAKNNLSFIKKIKYHLSPYKLVARWYIKGPSKNYIESLGITPDYAPPKIILRDHYCAIKYKKFMDNFNYYSLDKIGKYIYFPLQFQPEAAIDVVAPYFSNQIETARQVAMSLPGDYTLAVKEHPAMVGRRSSSYIEKIARTPNVKLIDYRLSGEKVLRGADLIISPNSTTMAEAAFLNKPAIQLGDLGTTLKLPNVFKHTDMTTLAAKIKEVLKINLKTEEYERKLENFVAAVYDTGFDVKYFTLWEKGKGDDMGNLWLVYKKEIIKVLFGADSDNIILKNAGK